MRFLFILLFIPSLAIAALPPAPPTLLQIANTEVWVKDGWFYTIVELNKLTGGTEKWCKYIPMTYINSMSSTRQKLVDVVTPDGGQAQIDECNGLVRTWKVAPNLTYATRPLKNAAGLIIGRISVGMPCEPLTVSTSTGGKEYRYATNSTGLRGIVLCQ